MKGMETRLDDAGHLQTDTYGESVTGILRPHATRLFPKNHGANAYTVTGIAAFCDWVLLSDNHAPHTHLRRNHPTDHPRHIFVSLRAPFHALRALVEQVLPLLSRDFVLITGSEDITLPRQTDARWRKFNAEERGMLARILDHPNLVHWYAENLDEGGHPKRSPLPLGLVFPEGMPDALVQPAPPLLGPRPLQVFCAHRHREGPQWETRRRISQLASSAWRSLCTVPANEMPEAVFMAQIERHAFVLCAEGGGLDPSPKAFSALLHGAIPIIRNTALAPAYARLPVVMVDDWTADALSAEALQNWRNALSPWFDNPTMRNEVLYRLSINYWWHIIENGTAIDGPGTLALHAQGAYAKRSQSVR